MRRRLPVFLLLCLLPALLAGSALASSVSGQSYDTFAKYYKADVSFINDNDNRHLLPLVIAKDLDPLHEGALIYSLMGDTLQLTVLTDPSGLVIESCTITLTAPQGLEYGTALYNDFAISGYQSYALLMAMHTDPDPARRYSLVTEVVEGMSVGNGTYERQLGVYTLTCTRQNNVAELKFHKGTNPSLQQPDENELPLDGDMPPALDDEDMEGLL